MGSASTREESATGRSHLKAWDDVMQIVHGMNDIQSVRDCQSDFVKVWGKI